MTLRDLFGYTAEHPDTLLAFFLGIPLIAILVGLFGKNEGHITPWKQLYSALVFGVCIPGILSVGMSVYFFLFERGRLMDADVFTQILPIVSMFGTLAIIGRNVSFGAIPGVERLSSLMMMIASLIVVMWLLDRTRIIAFSYIPIHVLLLVVVGALLLFRYGLRQMLGK